MSSPSKFHTLARLLQPSFLSAWLTVAASLATVLILMTPHLYRGSDFAQYFDSIDISNSSAYENYQTVSDTVNNSEFAADASVFVVWMVIGLVAFSIVLSVIRVLASTIRFIQDEEYFKEDRERLARDALVRLLVRAASAAGLYGFYNILIPFTLSYMFVFAHLALTGSWPEGVWYVLVMTLIVAVAVHVIVILLRLILLRVRVFFDRYSLDET